MSPPPSFVRIGKVGSGGRGCHSEGVSSATRVCRNASVPWPESDDIYGQPQLLGIFRDIRTEGCFGQAGNNSCRRCMGISTLEAKPVGSKMFLFLDVESELHGNFEEDNDYVRYYIHLLHSRLSISV